MYRVGPPHFPNKKYSVYGHYIGNLDHQEMEALLLSGEGSDAQASVTVIDLSPKPTGQS